MRLIFEPNEEIEKFLTEGAKKIGVSTLAFLKMTLSQAREGSLDKRKKRKEKETPADLPIEPFKAKSIAGVRYYELTPGIIKAIEECHITYYDSNKHELVAGFFYYKETGEIGNNGIPMNNIRICSYLESKGLRPEVRQLIDSKWGDDPTHGETNDERKARIQSERDSVDYFKGVKIKPEDITP